MKIRKKGPKRFYIKGVDSVEDLYKCILCVVMNEEKPNSAIVIFKKPKEKD